MAYGKIDPLVSVQIEKSIAEAVLPLQQTIARLEAAVDALKRERDVPEASAGRQTQKTITD